MSDEEKTSRPTWVPQSLMPTPAPRLGRFTSSIDRYQRGTLIARWARRSTPPCYRRATLYYGPCRSAPGGRTPSSATLAFPSRRPTRCLARLRALLAAEQRRAEEAKLQLHLHASASSSSSHSYPSPGPRRPQTASAACSGPRSHCLERPVRRGSDHPKTDTFKLLSRLRGVRGPSLADFMSSKALTRLSSWSRFSCLICWIMARSAAFAASRFSSSPNASNHASQDLFPLVLEDRPVVEISQ